MTVTIDSLASVISARLNVPRDSVVAETSFEEIGLDSVSCVEVSMSIYKELGIRIEYEAFEKMNKVSDLLAFINRMQ